MRQLKIALSVAAIAVVMVLMTGYSPRAGSAAQSQTRDVSPSDLTFAEWPLPEADRTYGAIDGHHIWQYVVEQSAISRRYRDQGHPQFWGRIIGTSGDAESAQWLLDRFKQIGMTDAHIQPIDLLPQWIAQSWDVTVTAGGKTLPLESAQPAYRTPGTQGQDLNLQAVYAGLGSEADFAGREVRGKAVFVFLQHLTLSPDRLAAIKPAEEKQPAAIFTVEGLPGNIRYQSYPMAPNIPTFSLGTEEGLAVRDLIAQAPAGDPPHVKIRLNVEMEPNLKTALVWGSLPGATGETIYVIAHRDGWFDAAGDNAGGVATMLGLAQYFAKIPKEQRRRTIVFIGMDGHHNTNRSGPGTAAGTEWLLAHRDEFFTKTALMINCEHPSNLETIVAGRTVRLANTYVPQQWYAGGPSRPELEKIAASAFREFGVTTSETWAQPSPTPPSSDLGRFYSFLPGLSSISNEFLYFHTDANTPETVPWTGLEATARAYAKIIDQVNKIDLKDLQRPVETDPNSAR